ncbi:MULTISPECIES: hypothetical protein [unclassified Burkholderia]|uniref:hypothetical protein n=1 Tax=unclassified Burkholderia TaxID=2613784 RepID=UPI001F04AE2E|nr:MULTISPECIES: hypothetical protein [unclassified Burkholderia]
MTLGQLGRRGIAPALHQDIQHGAVLIHGPPQPVHFAADRYHRLVEMPLVASRSCRCANTPGNDQAEFRRLAAGRFVREHDAADRQHFLDHPQVQREPVIELHRVSDHVGWKAMALERDRRFNSG